VYGGTEKFQTDPQWKDYILFHEYFHGDNGAGLGASHQTGWTGVVAKLIELFGRLDAQQFLDAGKQVPSRRVNPRRSGRVRYAGFLAGIQGTVLPMELPEGLATVDPHHLAQCQSTLQFGFKRRAHRIPHPRPGNGRRAGGSAPGPGLNPKEKFRAHE
jgi:hypothetical protein